MASQVVWGSTYPGWTSLTREVCRLNILVMRTIMKMSLRLRSHIWRRTWYPRAEKEVTTSKCKWAGISLRTASLSRTITAQNWRSRSRDKSRTIIRQVAWWEAQTKPGDKVRFLLWVTVTTNRVWSLWVTWIIRISMQARRHSLRRELPSLDSIVRM